MLSKELWVVQLKKNGEYERSIDGFRNQYLKGKIGCHCYGFCFSCSFGVLARCSLSSLGCSRHFAMIF